MDRVLMLAMLCALMLCKASAYVLPGLSETEDRESLLYPSSRSLGEDDYGDAEWLRSDQIFRAITEFIEAVPVESLKELLATMDTSHSRTKRSISQSWYTSMRGKFQRHKNLRTKVNLINQWMGMRYVPRQRDVIEYPSFIQDMINQSRQRQELLSA